MTSYDLIGAGNPIMDLLARVPDEFLTQHVRGAKGGMELVDADEMHRLVTQLHASPVRAPAVPPPTPLSPPPASGPKPAIWAKSAPTKPPIPTTKTSSTMASTAPASNARPSPTPAASP